ncbi:hypothetical protein OSTOST_09610 [Ostertagia ostertagi]
MAIFADPPMDSSEKEEYPRLKHAAQSFVKWYTRLVADLRFSLTVVLVWIVFVAGAIVGSSYSTVDLTSHKVFLPDSKLLELFSEFVNYKDALRDELGEDPSAGTLAAFLHWPEYSYYNGFIKRRNASDPEKVEQFMFVTGYRGAQLISWQEKRRLLYSLRREVDRYAKYVPLLAMLGFVKEKNTLKFADDPSYHLADRAGNVRVRDSRVFGYMSLFGTTLDPIVMSILIMCVGFSVDIPAHVSFHFHASRSQVIKRSNCSTINSNGGEVSVNEDGEESCFKSKRDYPQFYVRYRFAFVPLYMAQGFSTAMLLCISFSMIHGVVILPAMFCLYDRASIAIRKWISTSRRKKRCVPA